MKVIRSALVVAILLLSSIAVCGCVTHVKRIPADLMFQGEPIYPFCLLGYSHYPPGDKARTISQCMQEKTAYGPKVQRQCRLLEVGGNPGIECLELPEDDLTAGTCKKGQAYRAKIYSAWVYLTTTKDNFHIIGKWSYKPGLNSKFYGEFLNPCSSVVTPTLDIVAVKYKDSYIAGNGGGSVSVSYDRYHDPFSDIEILSDRMIYQTYDSIAERYYSVLHGPCLPCDIMGGPKKYLYYAGKVFDESQSSSNGEAKDGIRHGIITDGPYGMNVYDLDNKYYKMDERPKYRIYERYEVKTRDIKAFKSTKCEILDMSFEIRKNFRKECSVPAYAKEPKHLGECVFDDTLSKYMRKKGTTTSKIDGYVTMRLSEKEYDCFWSDFIEEYWHRIGYTPPVQ